MACTCGHQLKDHDWNFEREMPEPCLLCECENYEEEEKLGKERAKQMELEKAKLMRLEKEKKNKKDDSLEKQIDYTKKKIDEISEGASAVKIAPKVKIGSATLTRAKKIKEIAKEDKEIAEDWEKAKKGDIGVDGVYKKVQEYKFTELTIRRFYATEVKCSVCGFVINKQNQQSRIEKDEHGDLFRVWDCRCGGTYRENISKLREYGLIE